ncbi:MAG: hypothetical protein D4S01_10155 [Dehalococcoidia bacterium]|nr:MAG: hypothetical protein D4S01_10155 [Dehalococcoidia bacterium]
MTLIDKTKMKPKSYYQGYSCRTAFTPRGVQEFKFHGISADNRLISLTLLDNAHKQYTGIITGGMKLDKFAFVYELDYNEVVELMAYNV